MKSDDLRKFRGVVKEEIGTALKPVTKKLGTVTKKLDILWDQVVEVTGDLTEVKEILKSHTARNADNVERLDKRVTSVEDQLGISPLTSST